MRNQYKVLDRGIEFRLKKLNFMQQTVSRDVSLSKEVAPWEKCHFSAVGSDVCHGGVFWSYVSYSHWKRLGTEVHNTNPLASAQCLRNSFG